MPVNEYITATILVAGAWLSVWFKKLTLPAAITGAIAGWLVFLGCGYTGVAMMATFFILGTVATSWNIKLKEQIKAAEENKGRRKTSQVLANAGVAAITGALTLLYPDAKPVLQLMMAASFASATADTLSSELGTVYGKHFYNILSWKKDERGLDGVISFEGTLLGIAGSAVIACIFSFNMGWNWFMWLTICGTIGNLADSYLGAALERKGMLKNDTVNFLNTLIAALAMLIISLLLTHK